MTAIETAPVDDPNTMEGVERPNPEVRVAQGGTRVVELTSCESALFGGKTPVPPEILFAEQARAARQDPAQPIAETEFTD